MSRAIIGPAIRFPDDLPTELSSMQDMLDSLPRKFDDPYVFRVLIYFLSSLIPKSHRNAGLAGTDPFYMWNCRRRELAGIVTHVTYREKQACKKALKIIDQLDLYSTYRDIEYHSKKLVRGDPKSHSNSIGEGFITTNRGHDWIIRCAYELDIPDQWKEWLELMYEKQPYTAVDPPRSRLGQSEQFFLETLLTATNIDGFESMVSLIKFWLRQVLTVIQVWDECPTKNHFMPSYDWCVAAYQLMWDRLKNDLVNPFSEYPYLLRQEVLRNISFMSVFERCWKWVSSTNQATPGEDFDPLEVQRRVYHHILALVRDMYQHRNPSTNDVLNQAFGGQNEPRPYLPLEDHWLRVLEPKLREHEVLFNGLCKEFFGLPDGSVIADPDRVPFRLEYSPFLIEYQAVGARIDITQFVSIGQPAPGDLCTLCQMPSGSQSGSQSQSQSQNQNQNDSETVNQHGGKRDMKLRI
ncbi:hypothetical protein C7974DRAFT_377397 [Boeremia exigua]|uniref:uncharacterized protein n=1 Tax=Boeremia exigua TaxID=749465 RepID=UPI001E8EAEEE|nr:uncharacterized protein C7974DRAFT_377397 [Boeremia exigua]KAH6621716.1 hypothetical protein C7974DRAFT_377397 [Boeremia exigua]